MINSESDVQKLWKSDISDTILIRVLERPAYSVVWKPGTWPWPINRAPGFLRSGNKPEGSWETSTWIENKESYDFHREIIVLPLQSSPVYPSYWSHSLPRKSFENLFGSDEQPEDVTGKFCLWIKCPLTFERTSFYVITFERTSFM